MSLKETFGNLKKRLAGDPRTRKGAVVALDELYAVKTSDGVSLLVPCHIKLKVSDRLRYRDQAYKPDEMAGKIVEFALRREIAGKSFSELQQSGDEICNGVLGAVKEDIAFHCGLALLQVAIDKVAAPQGEQAAEAAKAVVEAEAAAQGVLQGLATGIQVKKPLTFRKQRS